MKFSIKLVTLCALLPAVYSTIGIATTDMFPYGSNNGDSSNTYHGATSALFLDWYEQITVPSSLPSVKWGGRDLGRTAYINFNGHLTFGANHRSRDPATITSLPTTITAMFYVFYSDNDLRRADGMLYYRLSTSAADLSRADNLIRGQNFVGFTSRYCILATWHKNKYYIAGGDKGDANRQQENTYQAALCVSDTDSHIIYHYHDMQWDRSEDPDSSLPRVGWFVRDVADADLARWESPNSGQVGAYQKQALESNVGFAGRWMRSTTAVGPCANAEDGFYAIDCNSYRECCGKQVQATRTCPTGTSYHPTLKRCIDTRNYNCGAANLCDGLGTNGNFADTSTAVQTDYIRCKNGIGRRLNCPLNTIFGSSALCQ